MLFQSIATIVLGFAGLQGVAARPRTGKGDSSCSCPALNAKYIPHFAHISSFLTLYSRPVYLSLYAITQASDAHPKETELGYLQADGRTSKSCTPEDVFTLQDGKLSIGKKFFSTFPESTSKLFSPDLNPLSIQRTFALEENYLSWNDTNFSNGATRFCTTSAGQTFAVFQGDLPSDCLPVRLIFTSGSYFLFNTFSGIYTNTSSTILSSYSSFNRR